MSANVTINIIYYIIINLYYFVRVRNKIHNKRDVSRVRSYFVKSTISSYKFIIIYLHNLHLPENNKLYEYNYIIVLYFIYVILNSCL